MTKQELRDALQSGKEVYVMTPGGVVGKLIAHHIHHNPDAPRMPTGETLELKLIAPRTKFHRYYAVDTVKLLTPETVVKFKLMGIITE